MPVDWTEPSFINAFSGAIAGAITAVVVCPLDVLKTRLQVQKRGAALRYSGVFGGLRTIVKEEGLRGMYRGLTPTLLALLPNWAIYFTAYDFLKKSLIAKFDHSNPVFLHVAAASGAGACTLIITNPLWVVKTRLQTQNMGFAYGRKVVPVYKGTFHALKSIVCEEGIMGLYSGLAPSLMGIAHVAVQFPLYEAAKYKMAHRQGGGGDPERLTMYELIAVSAFSKIVASTATYPHEVIRSHMHVAGSGPFTGLVTTCRNIFVEEGVRGFYRGCVTNLMRTTPAAAVTFTSFELLTRFFKRLAAEKRDAEAERQCSIEENPRPVKLNGKIV